MESSAKKLFSGGLLLSLAALLMRTIGVGFNVYVTNKIGAAGMGLLSLIMSVYSLSVTFAVSGISLATTRITAEAVGTGKESDIRHAMKKALGYSLAFGLATCFVLLTFAKFIGTVWLGDMRSVNPIRMFALSMPFISMSAAMQGYFTALMRVVKSASSQFFEQLVKISVTSLLLVLVAPKGLEYACMAVIGGGTVSEIASFIYCFISYKYDIYKHFHKYKNPPSKGITGKIFHIALPVALSSYLRTGLVTLEHMLIPRGLKKYGAGNNLALETYGILQGMVLPIILFPTAFLSSFNLLLVPQISKAAAKGERGHITYIGERFLRFTMVFSIGVAAVMMCFSHELGYVIYNSHTAADYIKTVAPLIPIMYLDSAVDSLLKGLDEQLFNMKINIIDASVSALLVWLLCPEIGIMGYIVTIFASEIFNLSCSTVRLMNITDIKIKAGSFLIKPLICAIASCTVTKLALESIRAVACSYISLFVHLALAFFLYFSFLSITNTLTKDDRLWIKSLVMCAKK